MRAEPREGGYRRLLMRRHLPAAEAAACESTGRGRRSERRGQGGGPRSIGTRRRRRRRTRSRGSNRKLGPPDAASQVLQPPFSVRGTGVPEGASRGGARGGVRETRGPRPHPRGSGPRPPRRPFSQFTACWTSHDFLPLRGYQYARLDGSTRRVQRSIDIAAFSRPGHRCLRLLHAGAWA